VRCSRTQRLPPPLQHQHTNNHPDQTNTQNELLCGFDFVVAPMVDPSYQQPALQLTPGDTVAPRIRQELMLSSAQWGGQVRERNWLEGLVVRGG